jgi:molecular chaperone GrpE
MAEERRSARGEGEGQVKVTDRRRFTPDGEPIERTEGPRGEERTPDPGAPAGEEERAAPGDDPRLARQEARIDELTRAYAALVEDNKSFRQRLEREKTRVLEAERASVAQALLEAADDLERALAAVTGAGETGSDALRNLAEGVRLSLSGLHKRILDLGAERIDVAGRPFDPHVAEAVDTIAVADAEQDGLALVEVRPGYRIGERVLRPARVRVGRLARA